MSNYFYLKEIQVEDRLIDVRHPMVFRFRRREGGDTVASCESYGVVGEGEDDMAAISDALFFVIMDWDDLCDMIESDRKGLHMSEFNNFQKMMLENFTELNLG